MVARIDTDSALRISQLMFCIIYVLLSMLPKHGYAAEADTTLVREWSVKIENCFAQKLTNLSLADPRFPIEPSGFAKMFIFEQVTKALPQAAALEDWEQLAATPVETFCEKRLMEPYKDAYLKGLKDLQNTTKGSLAPLGTGKIESSSIFVELTHNNLTSHTKGHFDITKEVLQKYSKDFVFSTQAIALMSSASQMPDLYAWQDERFHAHTNEYAEGDASDRALKIKESKDRFVKLLAELLTKAQTSASVFDDAEAIFQLGVACHLVQDLVYHRGMTLRQHAGLSYYVMQNPDFPGGAVGESRWNEATEMTRKVLLRARALLGEGVWQRLLNWTPNAYFNFQKVTKIIFIRGEDIGLGPLIEYYLMINPYVSGSRSATELMDNGCASPSGLACWRPSMVIADILE